MATNYYVTKETTCPRCKGYKVIQEPAWRDYWKAVNSKKIGRDNDAMKGFFADMGYFDWEPSGSGGIPPEECACPDCDGAGVLIEKVDLAEALRAIERV